MNKQNVLNLRPTQFAIGMIEVDSKIKKILSYKEKEIENHLESHPVPIVIGPNNHQYIIDHHHLVRACWESHINKVFIEIKADLSKDSSESFWKKMIQNNWVYSFDQFGNGPHPTHVLPMDIRGLADDPYRSLAWAIRESGGFDKCEVPFSEFKWAEFFRKKIQFNYSFDDGVKEALTLCKTKEASKLPGFKK